METVVQDAVELRMMIITMTKIMGRRAEQRLAELGLDVSGLQMGILRALWRSPKTPSELSRHFMLDPSTLVPIIDALERKGYVERQKDPRDRRRTPLALTESGLGITDKIGWLGEQEPFADAVRALGDSKTKQLIDLLRELVQQFPEGEEQLQTLQEHLREICAHPHKPE